MPVRCPGLGLARVTVCSVDHDSVTVVGARKNVTVTRTRTALPEVDSEVRWTARLDSEPGPKLGPPLSRPGIQRTGPGPVGRRPGPALTGRLRVS